MITLINEYQNPKGRQLIQEDTSLYVLSECCHARINPDALNDENHKWMQCINCDRFLQQNDYWTTTVEYIDAWDTYIPSAIHEWAKFMFGLEDVKFEVTI